jgi:hypothetical protein
MTRTKKNYNNNTKKYSSPILKNAKSNISKSSRKYKSINFENIKYNINDFGRLTQKGGNIFKHWSNMHKFKKFKKQFDKEEANIKKYMGSYKVNADTFKKIAESKRDSTTNYILNKRQLTILDMTKPKTTSDDKTDKNFLKSVISGHDLSMIENKTKRLEIEMSEANKQIAKNLPEFIKDKKKFQIRTIKFIKLVKTFSDTDIGKFNAKIKLKKIRYDEIMKQTNTKLKSTDKKDKNKYTKHKADYDMIAKFGDDVIQNQQKLVHEINELLENAEFYIGQLEALAGTKTGADTNIIEWDKLYRKIFEFLYKIIGNIGKTKGKIEEIKKLELEIDISLHPISQTLSGNTYEEKQLIESSRTLKNQQQDLGQVIQFLDASASNLNQILEMLINEKMASELYLDSTKIASAFEFIYVKMQKYMNIFKPIQSGGGSKSTKSSKRKSVGKNIIKVEIKPICHSDTTFDTFDNIVLRPDFNPDENLFIYTDSFENYDDNNTDEGDEYYNKFRKYRKDIYPWNNTDFNSLGIPVGFDTPIYKNNRTKLFDLSDSDFNINKNKMTKMTLINKKTEPSIDNAKNLLIQSITNIYKLLENSRYKNIKNVYYYKYCKTDEKKKLDLIDLKGYSTDDFTHNNIKHLLNIITNLLKNINKNTTISTTTPSTTTPSTTTPSSTLAKYSIHPLKYNRSNNGFEDIFIANKKKKSENADKMLFIYNDNFDEYCNGSLNFGANNAGARPFRQDLVKSDDERIAATNSGSKFRDCKGMLSLGIPIGHPDNTGGGAIYEELYTYNNTDAMKSFNVSSDLFCETNKENEIIKISMQNIYKYVYDNPNITDIYYSAKDTSPDYPGLGLGIFKNHKWTKDNIDNINNQLENLFKELGKIPNRKFTINKNNFDIDIVNPVTSDPTHNPVEPAKKTVTFTANTRGSVGITGITGITGSTRTTVSSGSSGSSDSTLSIPIASINVDGIAIGANGTAIIASNISRNLAVGSLVNINNMKATVQKNGTLFFDPNIPENSSINRIVKYLKVINKQNKYDNNIEKINKNVEQIYNILNGIITPQSEFMSISKDVQELSQDLIKLKFIEPKLIKANIGSPSPLVKKYSWVLNPVELIKSEFHALKGTETLDKLIKENKVMQEIVVKNSQVSDVKYNDIIRILKISNSNFSILKSTDEIINLEKLLSDNNKDNFIKNIDSEKIEDKCAIYSNLNKIFPAKITEEFIRGKGCNLGNQNQKCTERERWDKQKKKCVPK